MIFKFIIILILLIIFVSSSYKVIGLKGKNMNIINENNLFKSNYKSQFNQDIIMFYKYFYNVTNGFFIEIGAYDGITISNTYLFEKNLNWKGILIEGGSNNCKKLAANSKSRNNSIIICSPICSSNFTFYSDKGTGGRIDKRSDNKNELRCNTLKNITTYYKVKHIDFFSLDVEGSELEVLKTFDFNVSVSHWLIEWPHLSINTKNEITKILYNNKYIKKDDYISEIDVLFSHI